MNKLITFNLLSNLVKQLRQAKQVVVLVGGCFDILHLGHVRFLKEAKKYGTVIVVLESDANVTKYKGKNRPIHKQSERAEVLASLETVDHIVLLPPFSRDEEYFELTKTISPTIIAITEGDPQLENKQRQARRVSAKIVVVPKIQTPSTTQLAKLLDLE